MLDPYPLWLDAVEPVFERVGIDVVGRATVPEDALALVGELRPDLLVAEPLTRDHVSAMPTLRAALQRVPAMKLVVLTHSSEPQDMAAAFDAGAVAYVVKTSHAVDISAAIRQAFDHSIYFLRHKEERPPTPQAEGPNGPAAALTKRELEIVALVAEGHSNGVLARLLWVTEETVKFHLSNIYRKLGVTNRTEAGRWAHEHDVLRVRERPTGT